MRLGISDHKVIAAFVEQKPLDGHKLSTDGPRGEQIHFADLGSRAAQYIQKQVRHHAAPYMLADVPGGKQRR